jgi:ABC-type branched-subunit amino acid transport system substrate-binding protein
MSESKKSFYGQSKKVIFSPKEGGAVMKRVIIITSLLIFSLAFISGALAQEIKVGTLLSHTGPLKEFGPAIQNGAILAAKQMGAAGFSIKLIHEDSETSAIPATNAAKKLVEIDRVVAIIGALASGVTVPVAESVTSPNNVILISPASTSPLITVLPADQGKDFLFRTCPSDALQGVIAGKLAASYNKTAAVLKAWQSSSRDPLKNVGVRWSPWFPMMKRPANLILQS